jgi:hypothetical protein
MNKIVSKIKKFLKESWYETEPLVMEFFNFTIVIIAFYIVGYITESFIKYELKEIISTIKTFFIISALSLSVLHTLIRILIRIRKSILKELKDDEENSEDKIDKEDENNKIGENKRNALNPKPTDFDDADELRNSEKDKLKKEKIARDK